MKKFPQPLFPVSFKIASVIMLLTAGVFAQTSEPASFMSLKNSSFTRGEASPEEWNSGTEEGVVEVIRDTRDFHSEPASLKLQTIDGYAKGQSAQPVTLRKGHTYGLRGVAKSEGKIDYAVVALLSMGSDQFWQEIIRINTMTEWTAFEKTFEAPTDAENMFLIVNIDGEGSVWVDDLEFISADEVKQPTSVSEFDQKPDFAYLDFENNYSVSEGVLHLESPKGGKGGMGFNLSADFTRFEDKLPVLFVRAGPNNKAERVSVVVIDSSKVERSYTYSLKDLGQTEFTAVYPDGGYALGMDPQESAKTFKLDKVAAAQLKGDWSGNAVDLYIDRIGFEEPTPEVLAMQEARKKAEADKAAQLEQERQRRLKNVSHAEEGPTVERVFAVSPDMVGVQIQAQDVIWEGQVPFVESEEIDLRPIKDSYYAWSIDGEIISRPEHTEVHKRDAQGQFRKVGYYSYAYGTWEPFTWKESVAGKPIETMTVDLPDAYRISGGNLADEAKPVAVYRKSRPTDKDDIHGLKPYQHVVLLKLATPLEDGGEYTISFPGLNTKQERVDFTYDPRSLRSDAVQVSHIGYRADDPYKRGYLSYWAGEAGGVSYDVETFELLDDATGNTVYTGPVTLGFPATKEEQLKISKNFVKADVHYLDFSDFTQPGTYRVYVPGVGCSYPIKIGENTWSEAFKVSMHGFLSHRSGIELGPPFSEYIRPRNMHPDDGFKIFKLDVTRLDGEVRQVQASFDRLFADGIDESKLETHPGAWGGYMDAGDWDRRSQHLTASYDHLELVEMYPEYFESFKLALPENEANDSIPDLLNETMWNIDHYRRLQYENGGIGGGVESTSHPRNGEASWQETLLLGVFSPDPISSYHYAANAAKLSRLIGSYDAEAARMYRETAIRAFDYAQTNRDKVYSEVEAREKNWNRESARNEEHEWAPVAAIELYRLTEDERFHEAALEMKAFKEFPLLNWYAHYAYARLPEHLGKESIRKRSYDNMIENGEVIMNFAAGNAYGLSVVAPGVPMMGYLGYYSVPEMMVGPVLPRIYALTGDEKYLKAALVAANSSAGANPSNMTYTTGLGYKYPEAPLHIDSRVSGQKPPIGITVCGPSDPAQNWDFNNWVHQWHLQEMVPNSRDWPAVEAYVDLYKWPAMNEYTVHQQLRPTSFYWGFLAARPPL